MKQLIWLLYAALVFGSTMSVARAQTKGPEQEVRQLWQLLDYVAVDYPGAVQDGVVISTMEYEEMQEFSARAHTQVRALPPHSSQAQLLTVMAELKPAVDRKNSPETVAKLAKEANRLLLLAYPIPVAPRSMPNLSLGAALYKTQCASCHGATGGDGALASRLEPKPIAFTDHERARSRSLFALHQVISQGVDGTSMPAFDRLSEEDRWSLAFFVGSLSYADKEIDVGKSAFAQEAGASKVLPDMSVLVAETIASAT